VIHHLTRATRHLIFWSLITLALGSVGVRLVLAVAAHYKAELVQQISLAIEAPVQIGVLKAHMRGFSPGLILKDIKVADAGDTVIKLDEIRLQIDLREALLNRAVWSSFWVTLVGAEFSVTQRQDGGFAIAGLKANARDERPLWLLQGSKFELLRSRISWRNENSNSKPLVFAGVDLVVKNSADRHQMHMLMKLPANYGDSMRVSMALKGNFFEPAGIDGRMYFEGRGIHLAKMLSGVLPSDSVLRSGAGDFKLWTQWRHSKLTGVTGDVALRQLAVDNKQRDVFTAKHLAGRFNWKRQEQNWQLDVSDFSLATDTHRWLPMHFSLRGVQAPDGRWQRLALAVADLDLQGATELLAFPGLLPTGQAQWLTSLKLSGRLQAMTLSSDFDRQRFTVDGQFKKLSFASFKAVPGMAGLSGQIHGNDRHGWLQLETATAAMASAGLFRQKLALDRLAGRFNWRQTATDWIIQSPHVMLDVPGIQSHSRLRVVVPKNEASPFLDLQTGFAIADVSLAARYLPVTIMDKDVVAWLDRAFVAGRIPDGGLLVHGTLADFPYTEGQGVFEVLFDAEQVELGFNPEWPHLSDLAAEVRFFSESLAVNVHQAKAMQSSIKQGVVTIPSFKHSQHVTVKAQAQGSIANVLAFLRQSPRKASVERIMQAIEPSGETVIEFVLDAPLTATAEQIIEGSAILHNAQIILNSFELPINQVNGILKFNEQGVFAPKLSAVVLDFPIQIRIDNQPDQTLIGVDGQVGIDALQKQFDWPEWAAATGSTDYHLEVSLPFDESREAAINIRSDLQGVALELPGALAKTQEQKRSSTLDFAWNEESVLPVRLAYGNELKAAFSIDTGKKTLLTGHFLYGEGRAFDSGHGIKLDVKRDRIPLEPWLALYQGLAEGPGLKLDQVKIQTQHLLNDNQDLGAVSLVLKRGANGWSGVIQSRAANGDIQVPYDLTGAEKISLAMKFIDFSELGKLRLKNLDQRDARLPLFAITSQKTLWRSVDLGWLELETARIPQGLAFKRIALTGPAQKLNLTGSWTVERGQAVTQLAGSFSSEKFGRLLTDLDIYDDMKETRAETDWVLSWQGAPYQFALIALNGHVDITLKDGRLASIEPGIGRVLGILAFAQWTKRLQLDFKDIYKEGLSFDSIKGRIDLQQGIARTDDLIVNAVPAKISLTGDANLVDRTLDQRVRVVPKSSDAVPIAGTIVGQIAGLIANAVTDDYREGYFFGSEYQVQGSWQDPDITPLHESDGLFQKTWQSITGFPWTKKR